MSKRKASQHAVNRLRGAFPCLSVVYRAGGSHALMVASGFLFEEDGTLLWITAGHVLHDIRALQEKGLLVQMTWQDGGRGSIPASQSLLNQFAIDKDGLDLAIAPLGALEAENLRKGPHFQAFTFEDCLTREEIDRLFEKRKRGASEIVILGYPQEWASYEEFPVSHTQVRFITRVERVQVPILRPTTREKMDRKGVSTPVDFWSPHCFYGVISGSRAPRGKPLYSIEGLSGGPVVMHLDGRTHVVGIQSKWLARARTVKVVAMDSVKYIFGKYRKLKAKQLAALKRKAKSPTSKKRKSTR